MMCCGELALISAVDSLMLSRSSDLHRLDVIIYMACRLASGELITSRTSLTSAGDATLLGDFLVSMLFKRASPLLPIPANKGSCSSVATLGRLSGSEFSIL